MKKIDFKIPKIDDKLMPYIAFAISFLTFGWIAYCAPMAFDDFVFGGYHLTKFRDILDFSLHYGNGRILGNLGAFYLVNSTVIRVLSRALCFALITVLLPAVVKVRNKHSYFVSFALLLGMDTELFSHVVSWTSGFQNYVPPICLTLIAMFLIQKSDSRKNAVYSLLTAAGIFIAGFASQLYMEHSTVINALTALAFSVHLLKKRDRKSIFSLCWFISSVLGACVMFIIPKIYYIDDNLCAGYRSISFGGIRDVIKSCFHQTVVCGEYILCNALLIAALCFLGMRMEKRMKHKYNAAHYAVSQIVYIFGIVYAVLNEFYGRLIRFDLLSKLEVAVILIVFAAIAINFVKTLFMLEDKRLKFTMLFCVAFAAVSVAPFLIVYPFSMRCTLHSYMFLAAAAVIGFDEIVGLAPQSAKLIIKKGAVIGSVAALCFFFALFAQIRHVDKLRERYIDMRVSAGASEITVFYMPYEVITGDAAMIEKYYYHERQGDIKFTVLDYKSWLDACASGRI